MQKLLLLAVILLLSTIVTVNSVPVDPELVKTDDFAKTIVKEWRQQAAATEQNGRRKVLAADLANCSLSQDVIDEIHSYQDTVNEIIDLFMTGDYKGRSYDVLAEMTDRFGARLTGSQALEDTIDWLLNRASFMFFDSIYTEPVTVPHWVRNNESLFMTSPRYEKLPLLGLGTTVGTPPEGITAGILVVTSFEDLAEKASLAIDKIVVYNVPFTTYGETVQFRSRGAQEAARVGALASLTSSVTDFSINSPHTGSQSYSEDITKIPTACITTEDAQMLGRMSARGDLITLHLTMGAENFPDVETRNAIIEIQGTTSPEEVVVVSGHIDSWDVGRGAMDDGGGCTVSFMAAEALMELNLRPRRTFRTVLFTAEEQGVWGGEAYFLAHASQIENFQIMMESDFGTFYPRGIDFSGTDEAICMMSEIVSLTALLGTNQLNTPSDTPDLGTFGFVGVPLGSLNSDSDRYFWFHHSEGDTMEVLDSEAMDRVSALWTSVSYVLADVSFRLPH